MKRQFFKRVLNAISTAGMAGILLFSSAQVLYASPGYEATAAWDSSAAAADVLTYGMTPLAGSLVEDGDYQITVRSSSQYFRLSSADLHVENGSMTAKVHFDSTTYPYVYHGTPAEASAAPKSDYISCEETEEDTVFTFPVDYLNAPLPCAAYSKNRNQWYGRMLLFDAASLPSSALKTALPDYQLIEEALKQKGEHPEELLEFSLAAGNDSESDPEGMTQETANEALDEAAENRAAAKQVLFLAGIMIIAGGILNHFVQKQRNV